MRKLNAKDIEILKKLAPEIENKSRIEYRSILPPVSMHIAEDAEDFESRLERLECSGSWLSRGPHPGWCRVSAMHITGICRNIPERAGEEAARRECREDSSAL